MARVVVGPGDCVGALPGEGRVHCEGSTGAEAQVDQNSSQQ